MGKYDIHEDLKQLENQTRDINPAALPMVNAILTLNTAMTRKPRGLQAKRLKIAGYRGSKVKLTVFEPRGTGDHAPCLIYIHGGAFILKSAPHHKIMACAYALHTPCKVVFVEYSTALKHPFPAAAEECFAVYQWVLAHSVKLGVDPNRIAVGGDSAGGALAAALAQMARDRGAGKICFQLLIYPVTDSRQTSESMKKFTDTPVWNAVKNKVMWEMYLRNGDFGMRSYAAPLEAASLENLPPAYVEVAEFDCLHDEGADYARALENSGCGVRLNDTKRTVHGFEVAGDTPIRKEIVKARVAALREGFMPSV